jgi:uncharacterized protein involved in copper resistance
MRRVLKLWLMLIIALALPVQGFAAATMFHCASAMGHATAAAGGHDHSRHSHAGANDASHRHDAHADGASMHHAQGKAADLNPGQSPGCSACASCCTAAALPAAPIPIASTDAPSSYARPMAPAIAAFLTGGPERPPRLLLA